jgi:hypothetical protein
LLDLKKGSKFKIFGKYESIFETFSITNQVIRGVGLLKPVNPKNLMHLSHKGLLTLFSASMLTFFLLELQHLIGLSMSTINLNL